MTLVSNDVPRGHRIVPKPVQFPGSAESVRCAREWLQHHLGDHPLEYIARTVLSELAGNAVQHTFSGLPGGIFRVAMIATDDKVRVSVQDQGAHSSPTLSAPVTDDTENGRGLAMVELLTNGRWGVHHLLDRDGNLAGRLVWAELR